MPLVSGETAAGFNIVRLLGSGQIGELYLAEHPRLPRQYALKILAADISADPEYRFRFNQESDLAASVWHPHIVGIHDRGEHEERLWLAMDYVDATDTAQLLINTYPEGMPPDMVVEIVSVIADALDYAHERGLVHRYVNPSNILLCNSDSDRRRILLAGFGLARRADEVNNLTRRGLAIGTASYAAPEQLMDDSVDDRTDQYALACTAFHLLTGSPAFAHMNPAIVVSKHLNGPPPRPGDVRPELTYFDVPFARALMSSPSERFRRCRDFARALEAKEKLGAYTPTAAAAALLTVDKPDDVSAPAPSAAAPPAAEVAGTATPPDVLPEAAFRESAVPTALLQQPDVDDAAAPAEPDRTDVWTAPDDAQSASRRRRLLHSGALGLTAAAVALGGIVGVMSLRSASQSDDTPTNIDTPSPVTTIPTIRPAPATAVPPPVVKAPTHKTTTTPTSTASSATRTSAPVSSSAPAQTTKSHSASPTTPTSLDTRPAVGVPCGAPGASATSNSGAPVICADTPGGSAWEPPGG